MASAIIPIVELGLQEIPVLVPEIVKIINSIKSVIHKPAGTSFTPAQVTAAQTAALAMAKPVVAQVLPGSASSITDQQLAAFIEAIYQMLKAVPDTSIPVVTTSPSLQALQSIATFAALAQAAIAEAQNATK